MESRKVKKNCVEAVPVREPMPFYLLLVTELAKHGITQKKCAKMLGIGAHKVNAWCRGLKYPNSSEVVKLGRFFGMAEFAGIKAKKRANHKRDMLPFVRDLQFMLR